MKVQEFLEHHGIAGNPFAEEDAQNDTVFKRTCLETTFHPAWDKIFGDAAEPSTSIVFGEKGAGKTALKLQMQRQYDRHNADHPEARTFVVLYDDFNPFLDRFVSRVGPGRPVEKALAQWKMWDHMDAILALSVSHLCDEIIDGRRSAHHLPPSKARDMAVLAACYDQSTTATFPTRWRAIRRRVGYHAWRGLWPLAVGLVPTLVMAVALGIGVARQDSLAWAGSWWPWAALAAAWAPWVWRRGRSWWKAWRIVRSMRTGNRTVGQLTRALARLRKGV